MSERTFTIEEVDIKSSSKGPFRRIKASPGGWMSVFDKAMFDFVDSHLGQIVTADVVQNGDFLNIQGIQEAKDGAVAGAPPEKMSKQEWSDKDDRQRLGIMLSVHIEHLIEWKTRFPNAPDAQLMDTYDDVVASARKRAPKDLEWIKAYQPSKEVPFS